MVWAAISWQGKTELIVVDGKIDQVAYVQMLQEHLKTFIAQLHPRGCVFQQDNATAHAAKYTSECFIESGITVMDWPARYPD